MALDASACTPTNTVMTIGRVRSRNLVEVMLLASMSHSCGVVASSHAFINIDCCSIAEVSAWLGKSAPTLIALTGYARKNADYVDQRCNVAHHRNSSSHIQYGDIGGNYTKK
jgi:hypothetical protein